MFPPLLWELLLDLEPWSLEELSEVFEFEELLLLEEPFCDELEVPFWEGFPFCDEFLFSELLLLLFREMLLTLEDGSP